MGYRGVEPSLLLLLSPEFFPVRAAEYTDSTWAEVLVNAQLQLEAADKTPFFLVDRSTGCSVRKARAHRRSIHQTSSAALLVQAAVVSLALFPLKRVVLGRREHESHRTHLPWSI